MKLNSKRIFILLLSCLSISNSKAQVREFVDVCSSDNYTSAAMAFTIPASGCKSVDNNVDQLVSRVRNDFQFDAELLSVFSFRAGSVRLLEMIFHAPGCDTAGVLILMNRKGEIARSECYKLDGVSSDFRIERKAKRIFLYRKIEQTGKTLCLYFNSNIAKVNGYTDDGFSKW